MRGGSVFDVVGPAVRVVGSLTVVGTIRFEDFGSPGLGSGIAPSLRSDGDPLAVTTDSDFTARSGDAPLAVDGRITFSEGAAFKPGPSFSVKDRFGLKDTQSAATPMMITATASACQRPRGRCWGVGN